ncbi:methylmalonyl Co-A mutase-associated GTPase MeaB [Pseudacidobacterium ailaaui]|jgi:LAO/AO transport system kinase|uniref:methylmalonyl Co-A mutase-associated GTPase MeaB n=1 Tax=Pseudacidobacterium ailaaui TaxID=1382359 RepID=UPI0005D2C296|nr:methylmalonyl Co-A mutase-associated GTPase MeaB [Pseudacidobacterium ailaaui]MDI3253752.1 methylmalonyl Co-A mutase-associated GTPase MeaB [Bacillota bacterium]
MSTADIPQLIERLRAGDVRALARAISIVENGSPLASDVLSACFPLSGRALRVGVTGPPGAGKSTLVDQLARHYRGRGATVGVIAVDPTSPFSGGAILGDRIRMQDSLHDTGLYVRSMATRGSLGGLAQRTADVASVLEASGKEIILIETVGVGQDEVDIVRLADITLVVLVPGMGDDVQSIKAGMMEIADIFVINKADREGADRVENEVRAMQSLASTQMSRTPPVIQTVAATGQGLDKLASAIEEMKQWLQTEDHLQTRRKRCWRERLVQMVLQALMLRLREQILTDAELELYAARVARGEEDPYQLVSRITAYDKN